MKGQRIVTKLNNLTEQPRQHSKRSCIVERTKRGRGSI